MRQFARGEHSLDDGRFQPVQADNDHFLQSEILPGGFSTSQAPSPANAHCSALDAYAVALAFTTPCRRCRTEKCGAGVAFFPRIRYQADLTQPRVIRQMALPNIMTTAAMVATIEVIGMTVSGPKYAKRTHMHCIWLASLQVAI
jgi:hypothetical protein